MSRPGRHCPVSYRYSPSVFAREPELAADTIYVIGGLYGNHRALEAIYRLCEREREPVLVFNGDFHWFDVEAAPFEALSEAVLGHVALRGNVETELADPFDGAGCGCGYPDWVSDEVVESSNKIMERLRETSHRFPMLCARLRALPMQLVAKVGDVRVAIVHGDAQSLAGWEFSQEALAAPAHRPRVTSYFAAADVRIFASSHTGLPVAQRFDGGVVVNNGAAGLPNFAGTRYGVLTRISSRPIEHSRSLYGTLVDEVHVDALAVHYDHESWLEAFVESWPPGSVAHTSYHDRIVNGPDFRVEDAAREGIERGAAMGSS